jgi:hypothetical protein
MTAHDPITLELAGIERHLEQKPNPVVTLAHF